MMGQVFDPECRRCPRLAGFLDEVQEQHPDYFCKPVPAFGDQDARLLIVGLAPGKHGANATGRPFTGDYAGVLLYQTLYEFGLSTTAESLNADDGLELLNCRITNAVKCLPPDNKPSTEEIRVCNQFLKAELDGLPAGSVLIALGSIAHNAILRAQGLKLSAYKFGHAHRHELPSGLIMIDSYHCSRYNTQTRRLTGDMFRAVFRDAQDILQQV
jgi:uracil-DNA glycosylase family 4